MFEQSVQTSAKQIPELVVVLDLDRTLFDTAHYMMDIGQLLQNEYGISPQLFISRYNEYYLERNGLHYYDFFSHLRTLNLQADAVERLILDKLAGQNYLYDDVPLFLDLVSQRTDTCMILTFGVRRFQSWKYRLSPALAAVPFQDILYGKAAYIAQTYPGRQGIIIDYKKVECLPSGFKHIWISRSGEQGRYHSLLRIIEDWPHFQRKALITKP